MRTPVRTAVNLYPSPTKLFNTTATVGDDVSGITRTPKGADHVSASDRGLPEPEPNKHYIRTEFAHHFAGALERIEDLQWQQLMIASATRALPLAGYLAKPVVNGPPPPEWRRQIAELARRPNVCCKFSGVITEVPGWAWTPELLWPYFDVVLAAFGADRLMFGSDWPVCLVATEYTRWCRFVESCVTGLSLADRQAVLGDTATRFYRLTS